MSRGGEGKRKEVRKSGREREKKEGEKLRG